MKGIVHQKAKAQY